MEIQAIPDMPGLLEGLREIAGKESDIQIQSAESIINPV